MFSLTTGVWIFAKIVLGIIKSRKTATNVAHTIGRARANALESKMTTIQQKHFNQLKIIKSFERSREKLPA